MAAVVGLEVAEAGPETDALLAAVAARLGFERLTPEEDGYLPVTFSSATITGEQAWEQMRAALDATSDEWPKRVLLLPLGVVTGPRVYVTAVRDTGPTDGHWDDTLYVVDLHERCGPDERFRFAVARSQGRPTELRVAELVTAWAEGMPRDRGVVGQFREREKPHGRDRLAVALRLPEHPS